MQDRLGKEEMGVLRRQPVITHIDSFKDTSMCFVWALRRHTWAQYSAGANARAKQDVLRALKEAPQPRLASRLMSATHDETFLSMCKKCVLNNRERSKHMPNMMDVGRTSLLHWVVIWRSADSWLSVSSGGRRSTQFSQLKTWVST